MSACICTLALPKDGMSSEQRAAAEYHQRVIARALYAAWAQGVIITVETAPSLPLAMGNYDLEVSARPLRNFVEESYFWTSGPMT